MTRQAVGRGSRERLPAGASQPRTVRGSTPMIRAVSAIVRPSVCRACLDSEGVISQHLDGLENRADAVAIGTEMLLRDVLLGLLLGGEALGRRKREIIPCVIACRVSAVPANESNSPAQMVIVE